MSATQWNGLVEDMLHMVFDMHRPKWFMFDGAFPYRGMLNAIASQPHMKKWWMRRGSLKKNKSIPVDSQSFFDGIIVPSEGEKVETEEGVHVVAPIKAIEVEEAWERTFARSRLSIPDGGKAVYVQLGAGRINDIEGLLEKVLHSLFDHPDVYVILGESMLGERLNFTHERLRVVRDYPNALYALAFDASVQAGGYNSYQEMRMFGIPTLFIPNMDTGMDDQVARCKIAEEEGWGLLHMSGEGNLEQKIASVLNLTPTPIVSENGVHSIKNLLGISQS
jgi:UDP:flavonoid glycosyltransferase YjiC (YdhE family)